MEAMPELLEVESVDPGATTGLIYDLLRARRGEGPGLRSVVYLKGCPLRCVWCANPEGQAFRPEVVLFDERCSRCGRCSQVCEGGRHQLYGEQHLLLGTHLCDGCFDCANTCPFEALQAVGRVRTVDETMALLEQDAELYHRTGGGVTLAGGEPLYQDEYTLALLRAIRERGWHVAVDTNGYAPPLLFAEMLGLCDLVLFDLKETNSQLHTAWTSVPLEPVLDNLELAADSGVDLWVRCPVVPPLNDRDDHWERAGTLLSGLACVPPVHLLPYEPGGDDKRRGLGRPNLSVSGLQQPTSERLVQIAGILEGYGLEVHCPAWA